MKEAIELLNRAERPMIVAGNGAFSASSSALERLLEVTGLPIFTEETARGLVSDDHPSCFGYADHRVSATAARISSADAILYLGKKLDFTISFGRPPTLHPEVRIVQVEPVADFIGVSRGVDVAVVGDVGAVVEQLAQEAEGYRWRENPAIPELAEAREEERRQLESLGAHSVPIHAMSVHKALAPMLDKDSCLVFEGSDFALYGAAYHPSLGPGRWFSGATLGMIGWGVPFGLGPQVTLPDSRVVVLTRDGAY